jgi:very-short-patch-repair endonuclease
MIVKTKKDMDFVKHNFTPVRNKLLNKDSNAESHFEKLLTASGLYFRREKGNYKYKTRWSYFDFYIPYYNLYIEIDGESHNNEKQKEIDAEKDKIVLRKQRYIVRLTNEEVLSMNDVNIEFLLERCFEQSAYKRKKKGKEHSRNRYKAAMSRKREKGIDDMMKSANFDIDKEQRIWLYDNTIGEYFCFNNIIEAKFSVEMSINEIHDLCEMTEYRKVSNRRFVFAYTLSDCELRVMQAY